MTEEKEEIKPEKGKKAKLIFEERFICPHCNQKMIVKKTRKVISDPVPGEYKERVVVEKDSQTTLENK